MNAGKILATGTPAALKKQTRTKQLEDAFVALLPETGRKGAEKLKFPPRAKADGEPVIVAEGLTRRFGDFTAVDNVSFSIERGEIFGFLGSNGCGKTTTMKMLTGLLPASDGKAWVLGHLARGHDLETRKRVGYMSQSFSLYSELTVAQNLTLHARLFHLPREHAEARIAELIARFGLDRHVDELAGKLPLGLRQRLSLAVAIIHEPEMLILDEPTSGVDPVARDEFWRSLIELSRKEQVTIFISTHFMNEAMRCDRISLMHEGKVLACDTPEALVRAKKAENLEQAFIDYIREAEVREERAVAAAEPALERAMAGKPVHGAAGTGWLSPTRLLAYSYRETLEVLRDPVRLVFAFLGSAMLLLIMGYGITMDTEDLRYAVLDLDRTPESRSYLSEFAGSRYFIEQPPLTSQADLIQRLKANDIEVAIEIPPGFGRRIKREDQTSVSVWLDGASPFRAETMEGYVEGLHRQYLEKLARETGGTSAAAATIEPRYRYNPSFESIFAMAPRMPPILLILIPAILMAVSVVREKELGSITNFYVTPTKRLEFLLGKQLPYVVIAMLNFALLTAMVILIFQVPLKGSPLALVLGAFLYVWATTGVGLLVSAFTRSQVAAVFATTIVAIMPTIQFSGLLQPVSTLEGAARIMGLLWPTTYYMQISVGTFTKGLRFPDVSLDILALALFIPVFTALSAFALAKQER
jgi:ribosome-dependent ATPase